MENIKKRNVRIAFYSILLINFVCILVYNFITPYMSDDFEFSLLDDGGLQWIAKNAWNKYMTWNGRLIPQFIMIANLSIPKWIFNITNSIFFVSLVFLIYLHANFEKKQKYNIKLLTTASLLVWIFAISPGQTVLWVSGACNYLWPTVIMFGYLYLFRYLLAEDKRGIGYTIPMLVLGIISGFCNENTSGGIFLLALYFAVSKMLSEAEKDIKHRIIKQPLWCYSGLVGMIIGMLMLVLSPGGRARLDNNLTEENRTGLMALVGRLLKLNNYVKDDMFILICAFIVLATWCYIKKKSISDIAVAYAFAICSIITVYVLLASTPTMDRALFGASIMLMIGVLYLINYCCDEYDGLKLLWNSLISIGIIVALYAYLDDGTNLLRIRRELSQRDTIAKEQIEQGLSRLELPMVREEWDNRFTFMFYNDIGPDTDGWGNGLYSYYYDVDEVVGISWEEWEARE